MHPKKILVLTRQHNLRNRLNMVCDSMEAELVASTSTLTETMRSHLDDDYDLIVVDVVPEDADNLSERESAISGEGEFSLLLVVDEEMLATLRLPVQIPCDFVCRSAGDEELGARIRRLLWPGEEVSANDFIRQGSLTINLSTYQVKIDGDPVDFTYLEYALLAFLVTHPGHTYSRDALLSRVWDFDYYGGSRTVDVHVRRIRAKLGPDLAQYLKTVRGVGYLWSY